MLLTIAQPGSGAATGEGALRVLFIGNSYTRFNNLPRQVAELSRSVAGGPRVRARRETHAGYNLRQHWRRSRIRRLVRGGRFDAVVLQDHSLSPLDHPARMAEYVRRFHAQAAAAGARLVLFETWARRPGHWLYERETLTGPDDMLERVETLYQSLGRELGASVARVGRAWQRAHDALPETPLHRPDGSHPRLAGTYLSACVIYSTLTGRDPREASWRPWPMPADRARRIRELAASFDASASGATPSRSTPASARIEGAESP